MVFEERVGLVLAKKRGSEERGKFSCPSILLPELWMRDLDPAGLHCGAGGDFPALPMVEEFGLLVLAGAVGPGEGDFRGGAAYGIE